MDEDRNEKEDTKMEGQLTARMAEWMNQINEWINKVKQQLSRNQGANVYKKVLLLTGCTYKSFTFRGM